MRKTPVIGITLGDPGGIGPEILLKALSEVTQPQRFVVFGSGRVLSHHARSLSIPYPVDSVSIEDIDNIRDPYFGPGWEEAGRASLEYLKKAFDFFRAGKIDGLVTGPIHKESWHRCGYQYPGQTEYCAEQTGVSEFCMLMVGETFRIATLTTHLSLRDALGSVRKQQIRNKLRLLHRELGRLGFDRPKIACAALNPHAGESGAFGQEEQQEIVPALEELREEGIDVAGPLAPEVIFRMAAQKKQWDVILAMYHDQAMIPLKLLDFERSANVTLGLPLIRTSPDHGTAFDIAGRGIASHGSMKYAMKLALEWTEKRT